MGVFEDSMQEALASNPDLQKMPGIAVSAAQTPDPTQAAQALGHVANIQATQQAYQQVKKRHGWLDDVLEFPGKAMAKVGETIPGAKWAMTGLGYLNKPLEEVQHEYRYMREVYKRKGTGAGIAETLGMAAGGTLGAFAGGPRGAILGAEVAGRLEGATLNQDIWKATEKGGGSFGRDVSNFVGLGHNRLLSGALDGIFDLTLDPVQNVLGIGAAGRTAEGAGGLLGRVVPGVSSRSVESVDRALNTSRQYQRSLRALADMNETQVQLFDRRLAPIAKRIGEAKTDLGVHKVFRDFAEASEAMQLPKALPTMTLTRQAIYKAGQALKEGAPEWVDRYALRPFETEAAGWSGVEEFSNGKMSPFDADAPRKIYKIARYGMSHRASMDLSEQFAAATDPLARETIYENTIMKAIIGRSKVLVDEAGNAKVTPDMLRKTMEDILQLTSTREKHFGVGMDGHASDRLLTDEFGTEVPEGFRLDHKRQWVLPNFKAIDREADKMAGAFKYFGGADDWMYKYWTSSVFKPMALLSGGTAERIALSEILPQIAHRGLMKVVGSVMAQHYAEWGVKVADGEANHITARVYEALGGDEGKLANLKRVKLATRNLLMFQDDHLPYALRADHPGGFTDLPPTERLTSDLRHWALDGPEARTKYAEDRVLVKGRNSAEEASFIPRQRTELAKVARDPASREAARAVDAHLEIGGSFTEARAEGAKAAARYIQEHPEQYSQDFGNRFQNELNGEPYHMAWGRATSESMLGAGGGYRVPKTRTQFGANREVLKEIAAGRTPSRELLESIPKSQRPIKIVGQSILPDTSGGIQRLANVGWKRVLGPIINYFSREPMFNDELFRQYASYEPQIAKGVIDEETALMKARQNAMEESLKYVHNPMERSQLGYHVRNWMPFYFAQEQAWRRASRLLEEDPSAFRKYQLMQHAIMGPGTATSDKQGNGYLLLPATGLITQGTVAAANALGMKMAGSVASSLSGNLSSAESVFPMVGDPLPWHKAGPAATIPLKALAAVRPELGPVTKAVIGDRAAAGSMWDQIIPNSFIKNALSAFGERGGTTAQHNSTMSILQYMGYRQEKAMREWTAKGKDPNDPNAPHIIPRDDASPQAKQEYIDRVKNQSRVLDIVKSLVSLISPLSPRVDIGKQFQDLTQQYIKKYGDVNKAIHQMILDHPDLKPYTVFKTDFMDGQKIPATQASEDFMNNHSDLLQQFPMAAAYFIEQKPGDAFSQTAYNEQIAQHFREKKTAQVMSDDIYKASANALFFGRDLPTHEAAMKRLAAAGDTTGLAKERKSFAEWVKTDFGPKHPIWWASINDPQKQQNKQRAIEQMVIMFGEGKAPDTPLSHKIADLLHDFSVHQNAMSPGQPYHVSLAQRNLEKQSWDEYLKSVVQDNPDLMTVVNNLFRDPGELLIEPQ